MIDKLTTTVGLMIDKLRTTVGMMIDKLKTTVDLMIDKLKTTVGLMIDYYSSENLILEAMNVFVLSLFPHLYASRYAVCC